MAFLVERRAGLLAFEQGLGKTFVAIAAFLKVRAAGNADTLLVICPNSLKRNWVAEIAKFAPGLQASIVEGAAKARRELLSNVRTPVVIMSYETARAEMAGVLAVTGRSRCVLVLDESHWVKNRQSLTSTAARQFAPRCEYRWLLSGTPVTNTAADLHTQVSIVAAGRPLGSLESFMAEYGDARTPDRLHARVAPYVLRRTKDECLDLPEKTFVDIHVELPAWQRALYDQMRDELVAEVRAMTGEEFRAYAPTALARTLRLSQIASNPALILPTDPRVPGKLAELDALVAELVEGGGEKVILWSHYVGTIERFVEHYAKLAPVALYGATPQEERQQIAGRFQTDPSVKMLVGNPAAAGSGFTLTAARYAIYETLSWRYDLYAQSQDRNHRIGQERPVTYIRLIAADTVEEAIVVALESKAALARALLGDPEAPPAAATLSRDQFCEMLIGNRIPTN